MPINCGHCKEHHDTVQDVRECSQGKLVLPKPTGQPGSRNGPPYGSMDDNPPEINREVTEGMWYWGPRILKVQRAVHGSGRLYTKELVRVDPGDGEPTYFYFEMLKGGIYRLRQEADVRKMTVKEAAEFGKLYGICCRCARTLTDETSIALGIGPVCREKI